MFDLGIRFVKREGIFFAPVWYVRFHCGCAVRVEDDHIHDTYLVERYADPECAGHTLLTGGACST